MYKAAFVAVLVLICGCTNNNYDNVSPTTLTIYPVYGGECTVNEACTVEVAEAYGGSEPYTFQSDSYATGAPPMGMIVSMDGTLTGTPTMEGDYEFGVCVTDATSTSECTQTEVTIAPDNSASAIIDSLTCAFINSNTYGNAKEYNFRITASGTASGPVGAEIYVSGDMRGENSVIPTTVIDSWTGASELQLAARGSGNPQITGWSITGVNDITDYFGGALSPWDTFEVHVYVFINDGLAASDYATVTCVRQ
ncbi:hypothetical protein COS83_04675 [archaeon CG07_land_8_20_14_0_80_38_8]|nr:MAG: hypothetical protein COS83_04675 [archaeon CG07_land_8_20_14_0_80_38_8]